MVKKSFLIVVFLLFVNLFSWACWEAGHFNFEVKNSAGEVLYWGCYDAINAGPHMVQYYLTAERAAPNETPRPNVSFAQTRDGGDLARRVVAAGYRMPLHATYTNSGYDRGHMAPNEDFNDTAENATLTFFIANAWPQLPSVNRGAWLRAENEGRRLALLHGRIRIVIVVDEFLDKKVGGLISVPMAFTRFAYFGEVLLSAARVYQE